MDNFQEQENELVDSQLQFFFDENQSQNRYSRNWRNFQYKPRVKAMMSCILIFIFISLIITIITLAIIKTRPNEGSHPNCRQTCADYQKHRNETCNNTITIEYKNSTSNQIPVEQRNTKTQQTDQELYNRTCNNTIIIEYKNSLNTTLENTTSNQKPAQSCNNTIQQQTYSSCESADCYSFAAQLFGSLDTSVKPCDDFYQYACGNWIKNAEIDDLQTSQNGFAQQSITTFRRFRNMLESPSTSLHYLMKVRKAYQTCIHQKSPQDLKTFYSKKTEVIQGLPIFEGEKSPFNANISNFDVFFNLLAKLKLQGWPLKGPLFTMDVIKDWRNNNNTILLMSQPHTLPLNESDILSLVKNIFPNKTYDDEAGKIAALANKLDEISENVSSNFSTMYDIITIEEFTKITKKINWLKFFNHLFKGIRTFKSTDKIAVILLNYFKNLGYVIEQEKLDLKSAINLEGLSLLYIIKEKITGIDDLKKPFLLPARIRSYFNNVESLRENPRWFQCVQDISSWFALGLEVAYVKQYYDFDNDVKIVDELAQELIDTFKERLDNLTWLDEPSRNLAKEKLTNMRRNYLFPDWARDPEKLEKFYADLYISFDHTTNFKNVIKFHTQKTFIKLKVNRTEELDDWLSNSIFPNAFYYDAGNSFFITTTIVQSPTFGADRLRAMNYGGIGSILGHEITHGYDLTGTQFNQFGNLQSWLTPQVAEEFQSKTRCFIDQYSKFQLTSKDLPSLEYDSFLSVNGKKTASENIADNGGLQQAFWAYQKWKQENGPEKMPDVLRNFTADQIFFISFSQIWCNKYSNSEYLKSIIKIDRHSPAKFRILGSVANSEEFHKAFNCPPLDKTKICKLW